MNLSQIKTLVELRDALNSWTPEYEGQRLEDAVDLAGLPLFDEADMPRDTCNIWSWDMESLLLYNDLTSQWYIEKRPLDEV